MTATVVVLGDQVGDARAPIGTSPWVQAFRLRLKGLLDQAEQSVGRVRSDLEMMRDKDWFRQLDDRRGHPFMTFESFCEAPWPQGLGLPNGVGPAIIAERNQAKRLAVLEQEVEDARILATPSERGKRGGRGKKATTETSQLSTSSKKHILSELKTSAPDILRRYRAGEFKSAAAARREAVKQGLLKPRKNRTTLQVLRATWRKATPDERRAFLEEVRS